MIKIKPRDKKKRRGVFYTPLEISELLTDWALRSPIEKVLEPSFGGCRFIESLKRRLDFLNCATPDANIYGCDIDKTAFKYLSKVTLGKNSNQFLKRDFLTLTLKDFCVDGFDAILGNPPYVSYHNMFQKQRIAAKQIATDDTFQLPSKASLWAYFVFHSLKFLKHHGRMAWLLPSSLLNADYAKVLLHELERRFHRVVVISLVERLFENDGTDETTELLLCEGFMEKPSTNGVEIINAANVSECVSLITKWNKSQSKHGVSLNGRVASALMPADDIHTFKQLAGCHDVIRLGDLARILIGIVTGANAFFVVSASHAAENHIPAHLLQPILSKFALARGLHLTPEDLQAAIDNDRSCLLISTDKSPHSAGLDKYLSSFPVKDRKMNQTFKKREIWHQPNDHRTPDAFIPYMHHFGPRLAINTAGVNSTNTIHRVYFNPGVSDLQKKLATISILTTFSQLSAEIEGRTYGSGVLKHEPSEARNIKLFMPQTNDEDLINSCLCAIDQSLRCGSFGEASMLADAFIFDLHSTSRNMRLVKKMTSALTRLRTRRYNK